MSRITLHAIAACMTIALLLGCCLSGSADVTVVFDGKPLAAVIVGAGAPEQVTDAAALLVSYVREATGATLPVVKEGEPVPEGLPSRIYIGQTDYALNRTLLPEDLDGDGFVIGFPDQDAMAIVGPTPWGTEFGVYEFLERYVGVRWLLPGPDGDDVPAATGLTIPAEPIRDEPRFFSRLMSGYQGAGGAWARRLRAHGRVGFHHNLIRLFPPEEYTQTHPEFFPMRKGERFLPKDSSVHGWQPCFTAPGSVEEAIKNIKQYFAEHPDVSSYSLGVNDSSGHCECEACQAMDTGENNFLGRRDVSDRYFTWANAVVERVLEEYPDKWFGCLAYSEVAAPPTKVAVHERIIPYMTYDRMKWVDPVVKADGVTATKQWEAASPTLGWYDYIYGTPYLLPRVWFHHMADYLRFGYENGVRALYAEAYPNFGEGPKLYVAWKLQWDPYLDVDQLLDEWYERCVGPDAAPALAEYYGIWERFWTHDVLESAWWTQGGQYLAFSRPGYLADVPAEYLTRSRELLETALEKADTTERKARAGMLLRAFEYYEASTVAYQSQLTAGDRTVTNEQEALEALEVGVEAINMAARRWSLVEQFAGDPVLQHPLSLERFPALTGADWGSSLLWRAAPYALDGAGPVRQRMQQIAESGDSPAAVNAQMILAVAEGKAELVSTNPSFEEGTGGGADGWMLWVKFETGSLRRSTDIASDGQYSLLSDGMKRGGPLQTLEPVPGRYLLKVNVYAPEGQADSGTCELAAIPVDENGNNLPSPAANVFKPVPGRWDRQYLVFDLPEEVHGKRVDKLRPILIIDGFTPEDKVYIDEFGLYRLPDEG